MPWKKSAKVLCHTLPPILNIKFFSTFLLKILHYIMKEHLHLTWPYTQVDIILEKFKTIVVKFEIVKK